MCVYRGAGPSKTSRRGRYSFARRDLFVPLVLAIFYYQNGSGCDWKTRLLWFVTKEDDESRLVYEPELFLKSKQEYGG